MREKLAEYAADADAAWPYSASILDPVPIINRKIGIQRCSHSMSYTLGLAELRQHPRPGARRPPPPLNLKAIRNASLSASKSALTGRVNSPPGSTPPASSTRCAARHPPTPPTPFPPRPSPPRVLDALRSAALL